MKIYQKYKSGFSLLEILVSMAILSTIILILSSVFNHSSKAFDHGINQSRINIEGRAILNQISIELKNAVASNITISAPTIFNTSSMSFNTITIATTNDRIVKYISYKLSGSTIIRSVSKYGEDYSGPYIESTVVLANNVKTFTITTSNATTTNFPYNITISIGFKNNKKYSSVNSWSAGPDGIDNTNDDIHN